MAVITSAAAGLASVDANWVGGVRPADGDTIIQNHDIDYDYDIILGTSGVEGTLAIDAGAGRVIKFKNGAFIELRGCVRYAGTFAVEKDVLVWEEGSTTYFNAEHSADPANTNYDFRPLSGGTGASILIAGTQLNPVSISSNANFGRGRFFRNAASSLAHIVASWCTFTDLGTATDYMYEHQYGGTGVAASKVDFQNCIFLRTRGINCTNSAQANGIFRVKNCTFKESLNTSGNLIVTPTFTGAGTKDLRGSIFDKVVFISDGAYQMGDGGAFLEGWAISGRTIATVQTGYMLYRKSTAVDTNNPGDLITTYWLMHSGTGHVYGNPHFISAFMNRDYTFDRVIGEYTGTAVTGDFFATSNPAVVRTHTIKNCILLPNANNTVPGKFLSGGSANVNWTVEHNTFISSVDSVENGVSWGELAGAHANMFLSVKSNLAWHPTVNKALVVSRLTGALQDAATPANISHNGIWNAFAGTDGDGFHSFSVGNAFTSTPNTVGEVLLASDPFVDSTRNIATWYLSIGGSGATLEDRINGALAEISKKNDFSGFNPAATVEALHTWVEQGFNVTAATLENAGHDGVTIGARPFATLNPKSKIRYRINELIGGI